MPSRVATTASSRESPNSAIHSFLTPESMLTSGFAGALVMMITNALALNFGCPRAHAGIGLSFLIGLLVLVSERKLWLRLIYYVLNSLVIFCVALGTNGVGTAASTKMALTSIISEAHAENNSSSEFSLLVALLNSKEERTKAIINLLNDVRNTSALNEKI